MGQEITELTAVCRVSVDFAVDIAIVKIVVSLASIYFKLVGTSLVCNKYSIGPMLLLCGTPSEISLNSLFASYCLTRKISFCDE